MSDINEWVQMWIRKKLTLLIRCNWRAVIWLLIPYIPNPNCKKTAGPLLQHCLVMSFLRCHKRVILSVLPKNKIYSLCCLHSPLEAIMPFGSHQSDRKLVKRINFWIVLTLYFTFSVLCTLSFQTPLVLYLIIYTTIYIQFFQWYLYHALFLFYIN